AEAEVLDAEAGRSRPDHVCAPSPVVLDSACARLRVMQIDPVVGEWLGLRRHQRNQGEVAVPEVTGRRHDGGRRRWVETEHQVLQGDRRNDGVDAVLEEVAVLPGDDTSNTIFRVLHGDAAVIEVDVDPTSTRLLCKRLPHLPRPQPWIPEFLYQCRHVFAAYPEHCEDGLAEREVLDPLRCPL